MTAQTCRTFLGYVAGAWLALAACAGDGSDGDPAGGELEPGAPALLGSPAWPAEDTAEGPAEETARFTEAAAALVSCSTEADCGGGLACVGGACQACSQHSQCASDVCNQNAATPLGPGACVREAATVYVDRSGPTCEAGDGSRANPVCEIFEAVPRTVGGKYVVRVYPGQYRPFLVASRTLYIFGPGDGSVIVGEEDISSGTRVIGATALIDGVDFGVHVLTGMVCEGSTLKVARATVAGDYHGLRATNCNLELDRVRVDGMILAGLTVAGAGRYRITNSYFSGEDHPSVIFSGSSTGSFLFNTVRGGGLVSAGGIDCGSTARVIQDSIVVSAGPGDDGGQTVGACTHRRVVVGSSDRRADAGLIKIDPALDAEGRLLDTPENAACCIDRGARYVSSLYRDFYGTQRPRGASNDIGAHERDPAASSTP